MRGKWLLFAGVTILTAIAAGTIAVWRQNSKPVAKDPAPVAVAPPAEDIGPEINLSGKVQAQKIVNVAAPIDGNIENFVVDAGDSVFEGQLLARIKNARVETSVEAAAVEAARAQSRIQNTEAAIIAARLEASRARADAARAQSEFERASKAFARQKLLFSEGATPRLLYEKAQAEDASAREDLQTKEALARQADDRAAALNKDLDALKRMESEREDALEHAKAELAGEEVHSPVDGIVVSRRGQPGDEVTRSNEDLFRIATALSAMEIILEPSPAQLAHIKPGQMAVIQLAEAPDAIEGRVSAIKSAQVTVEFISPTPLIKPGLTAQVTIKIR